LGKFSLGPSSSSELEEYPPSFKEFAAFLDLLASVFLHGFAAPEEAVVFFFEQLALEVEARSFFFSTSY
jgi:hypothetical protein